MVGSKTTVHPSIHNKVRQAGDITSTVDSTTNDGSIHAIPDMPFRMPKGRELLKWILVALLCSLIGVVCGFVFGRIIS